MTRLTGFKWHLLESSKKASALQTRGQGSDESMSLASEDKFPLTVHDRDATGHRTACASLGP